MKRERDMLRNKKSLNLKEKSRLIGLEIITSNIEKTLKSA